MTSPVLPGEGPMTDEELERFTELVKFAIPWARDTSQRNALIAAYVTASRRLLGEVKRLRAEFADFREMAVSNSKAADEAVDRARSECAALAAKAQAAVADRLEQLAKDVVDQYYGPAGTDAEHIITYLRREALAERQREAALEAGSGMPHTPAQEARGDAETAETGSGRGTGVREPHGRPQGLLGSVPIETTTERTHQ